MWRMSLLVTAGIAVFLGLAIPALAGGGGGVSITRTRGRVMMRPIDFRSGRPTGPWRQAKKGGVDGTYLMRVGRGSWAHVTLPFRVRQRGQWRSLPGGCVDSGSLVRIDSYADSSIRTLRGKVSRLDGKRVGRLPSHMGWGSS
jgi:hypothetical protein